MINSKWIQWNLLIHMKNQICICLNVLNKRNKMNNEMNVFVKWDTRVLFNYTTSWLVYLLCNVNNEIYDIVIQWQFQFDLKIVNYNYFSMSLLSNIHRTTKELHNWSSTIAELLPVVFSLYNYIFSWKIRDTPRWIWLDLQLYHRKMFINHF